MQLLDLSQLNEQLNEYDFFLIDEKVHSLYSDRLTCLEGKKILKVSEPESFKTLKGFETISHFFLEQKIRRTDKIVIIGGGALSDVGGYVALSLLRGVQWVSVPTTLLAMIDASIGGKVGINTDFGKNLLGGFHSPCLHLLVPDFLISLDEEQLDSGRGELLKYFFLSDKIKKENFNSVIQSCAEFKGMIVKNDPFDTGIRECLNLGHTFGHAIEKQTGLSHGISVMHGINLSIHLFSPFLEKSLKDLLDLLNLKVGKLALCLDETISLMERDKKNIEDKIRFITLNKDQSYKVLDISSGELKTRINESEIKSNYFV